ncbi:hypothetical protein [Ferrovibrio sp.]|uniref:hypothetical protein n=1 Tax=Ferrovibrio sp. TaxID=1917215 RepID=UPI003D0F8A02
MKAALIAALVLLPGSAWACLPGFEAAPKAMRDGVTVAWKSEPAQIKTGVPFALELAVCPAAARLSVDAHMPAHRHGMNYQPSIRAVGEGRFRAEGLVLHMPGEWEFVFEAINAAGKLTRLTTKYQAQ